MSDFNSALEWLTEHYGSSMTEAANFLLEKYQEASASDDNPDEKAARVEAAAEASRNPAATAEALVRIAQRRYEAGRYVQAWRGLDKAVTIYAQQEGEKKSAAARQRLWAARWLAGWAGWKAHLNYSAYQSWLRARDEIEVLIQNSADEGDSAKKRWYEAKRAMMEVELACRPEEAYTWLYSVPDKNVRIRKPAAKKLMDKLLVVEDVGSGLNVIGMSKMRDDLISLRNRLPGKVKEVEDRMAETEQETAGNFTAVQQIVKTILEALEVRADLDERAEALLECGLAMHQIGDHEQAAKLIERAVSNYLPGSHQKAVVRWMYGLMQMRPEQFRRGFDSFRRCMEEMRVLLQRAQYANNLALVKCKTSVERLVKISPPWDGLQSGGQVEARRQGEAGALQSSDRPECSIQVYPAEGLGHIRHHS
jgi:tetratricopeptide (TPR) repeat protein